MPDVEKIKKLIGIVADEVFSHSLGLLIISKRILIVEFKEKCFEIYREVCDFLPFEEFWMAPVREDDHPDYYIDFADCRIYEKHCYRYPSKNVESFILRKIFENL